MKVMKLLQEYTHTHTHTHNINLIEEKRVAKIYSKSDVNKNRSLLGKQIKSLFI